MCLVTGRPIGYRVVWTFFANSFRDGLYSTLSCRITAPLRCHYLNCGGCFKKSSDAIENKRVVKTYISNKIKSNSSILTNPLSAVTRGSSWTIAVAAIMASGSFTTYFFLSKIACSFKSLFHPNS